MATKKSAAPAKAAAKKSTPADRTDKLIEKIKNARDVKGQKWAEIAESVGLPVGKTILLWEMGSVPRGERITGTDAEIGKQIVQAREQTKLSWARIMARTGLGLQRCKALYAKYSKDPARGARIGKGGRYPGDATPPKAKAEKAAAKKAPAKKAAAAKSEKVTPIAKGKKIKAEKAAEKTKIKPRPKKKIAANPGGDAAGDDQPF